MMDGTTLSAADVAAVTRNDGFGGFGGDGGWWLILLFLFAFNGGWNNGGYGGGAAQNYVLASDFATLQRQLSDGFGGVEKGLDTIRNGLCDGFYTEAQLVNGVNVNMLQGFNGLQAQIADCCCQNRYDALQNSYAVQTAVNNGFCQTNFNNQNNTRDIIESQNCGTRAILEKLNAQDMARKDEKIADQNQQIFALQLAASQAAQNNYLVNQLRPAPIPAFAVPNPYQYNGCGCNC